MPTPIRTAITKQTVASAATTVTSISRRSVLALDVSAAFITIGA